jgi:hypothetical protein
MAVLMSDREKSFDAEVKQAELESLVREEKAIYERTIKGYEFDSITGELMQRLEVLEKAFAALKDEIIDIARQVQKLREYWAM